MAILKVGLPLVALGMLSALFLIQPEDRGGGGIAFSQGDLEALGSGLRISNPTFSGVTRDEDRFQFTADLVVPDAAPPKRASISNLDGHIDFLDGTTLAIVAKTGELDLQDQRLALDGAVSIETTDGYTITSDRMNVDLRAATVDADGGVRTTGPMGRITSKTAQIVPAEAGTSSRLISFGNGVRVVYDPPAAND